LENLPKISIITPSYNQGQYLEDTILSVLNQNYSNLEYIIIDGGSTDNSVEIIKKYEKHLTYWVSEKDNGMYQAIQKGFGKSTGDIMAWLNSDDMYHPKSLFTVAEIFNQFNNVNWLHGCKSWFDEQGKAVETSLSKKWSKYDYYLGDYKWIQQESVFWRRSLWEKAGGCMNIDLKYSGDLELWLRFFRYEKLYITNALIGGFRYRSDAQMSVLRLDEYLVEANKMLKSEVLDLKTKRILKRIQLTNSFISFISKFRIFNQDILRRKYYDKLFEHPPQIQFNRTTQVFELC